MSLTTPSKDDLLTLLSTLESHFPSRTLGPQQWFILALACLVAGGHPDLSADLYLHLIARPEYQTPEERQALVRRLREVLVECRSALMLFLGLRAWRGRRIGIIRLVGEFRFFFLGGAILLLAGFWRWCCSCVV
jgi:hypothetical protein